MVKELTGKCTLEYHYDEKDRDKKYEIDFKLPFKRIRYCLLN